MDYTSEAPDESQPNMYRSLSHTLGITTSILSELKYVLDECNVASCSCLMRGFVSMSRVVRFNLQCGTRSAMPCGIIPQSTSTASHPKYHQIKFTNAIVFSELTCRALQSKVPGARISSPFSHR
eukprot:1185273-Prorocentrum_minimum.AAC.4